MTNESRAVLATGLVGCGAVCNGVDHNGGQPWTLTSGRMSWVYCNCRGPVYSTVAVWRLTIDAYMSLLADLQFDLVIGMATAGLEATGAVTYAASYRGGFWRKEKKEHGISMKVEAVYEKGETVVVLDDVLTSGGSIAEAVEDMRNQGLVITDAIVLVDREQGGRESLAALGVTVHSGLTLQQVLDEVRQTSSVWSAEGIELVEADLEAQRERLASRS